jgi:uncharacterized protein YecE (DUF72 family)
MPCRDPISPSTHIVAASSQVSSTIRGDTVMLDLESGTYFGTTAVGSEIWRFIQEPRSFADVVEMVVVQFSVSLEQAEQDAREFVERLSEVGLIETRDAGTTAVY